MIEPVHDYVDDVVDANRYITDPEDPAPRPKGRYKQDWETSRTVDKHDPDHITGGFSWTTERK